MIFLASCNIFHASQNTITKEEFRKFRAEEDARIARGEKPDLRTRRTTESKEEMLSHPKDTKAKQSKK